MADSIVIGVQTGVGEQLPARKQFTVYLLRPADSCNWIIWSSQALQPRAKSIEGEAWLAAAIPLVVVGIEPSGTCVQQVTVLPNSIKQHKNRKVLVQVHAAKTQTKKLINVKTYKGLSRAELITGDSYSSQDKQRAFSNDHTCMENFKVKSDLFELDTDAQSILKILPINGGPRDDRKVSSSSLDLQIAFGTWEALTIIIQEHITTATRLMAALDVQGMPGVGTDACFVLGAKFK
ncbi:hypothetical protein J6590_021714 [Homalodisca vitripennis]|nr:hypothetical protein J6590_021714 [Homalodisca vitripennis]